MTQKFYTRLTEIGQAKYANAVGVGSQIEFTQLAVGDANGQELTPEQVQDQEGMVNERRVGPINQVYKDADNPNWLIMEQVLPPEVGGWTIREVGIYDVDGDLVAYGNYPSTYKPILEEGSSRTSTVRFVLMVSDTSVVTLKVDPAVVLATRKYVDDQRAEHEAGRDHPAATELAQGMIQRATSPQALGGSDNTRAMTAARVHEAFKQFGLGTSGPAIADLDSAAEIEALGQGLYSAQGGTAGRPIGGGGTVLISKHSSKFFSISYRYISTSDEVRVFERNLADGTFSAWREVYHTGNLTLQQHSADSTTSALLKVGAFGLGSKDGLVVPGGDVNATDVTGFYEGPGGGTINGPFGINLYGTLLVESRTSGSSRSVTQLAIENSAAYFRFGSSGGEGADISDIIWGEWRELYHTGNAIADQATVDAGADDTKFVTSKKLKGSFGDLAQNVAVFDIAGITSWDVPQVLKDGRRKALVTVTGGGGSGAAGSAEYCSGGGAGATSIGVVDLSGVASVEVTVGTGGAGRSPTGPGNSGESSSFGAYITAPGGIGGKYQTGASTGGPAGVGGDINIPGGDGTNATVSPSATLSHYGGTGGASYFRGGSTGASNAGDDATHGAGGGGNRASASKAGGDGIVTVRW